MLFAFLMRLLALAAGMVFAAGVLVVTFVGAMLLLLHAGWTRLGGRPVRPIFLATWGFRGFASWMARSRPAPGYVPQRVRVPVRDITDVQPK
jgi:hypothetical protein